MKKNREKAEEKLRIKCEALADLITGVQKNYKTATPEQKAFIETTIGAALWYLPELENSFSGYISVNLLEQFKIGNQKISKDHLYPRKISAQELNEGFLNWKVLEFFQQSGIGNHICPDSDELPFPVIFFVNHF